MELHQETMNQPAIKINQLDSTLNLIKARIKLKAKHQDLKKL